jgi:hypothetical protein
MKGWRDGGMEGWRDGGMTLRWGWELKWGGIGARDVNEYDESNFNGTECSRVIDGFGGM